MSIVSASGISVNSICNFGLNYIEFKNRRLQVRGKKTHSEMACLEYGKRLNVVTKLILCT